VIGLVDVAVGCGSRFGVVLHGFNPFLITPHEPIVQSSNPSIALGVIRRFVVTLVSFGEVWRGTVGSIYGFVVCQRCRVWGIRRCVRYRGVPIPTDKDAFSVIFSSSTYRPNVFMRVLDQGGISGVYVDTENMESVECRSGERDVDQVVLNV